MPVLLIVGGGLFGSQAAAYARSKGIETRVFDAALDGAASPAAAGLFKEAWAGKRLDEHYRRALPVLDRLYGIRSVTLANDNGDGESYQCVPPSAILEKNPIRARVTAVGDGWLETETQRHEGWVYIAAGIWCKQFLPDLEITGKAGAAFAFRGERPGKIHSLARGRQAIAFVRDKGCTHFSDGTAERDYTHEHEQATLSRATALGLTDSPVKRFWGYRPYTPGGPVFRKIGERTWIATGGRKMGTILGASFACRLIDEVLRA